MTNAKTPNEMFEYGKKLLADAHREYEKMLDEGIGKDDAYWAVFDGLGADNYDTLAIIWAAGALSYVFESDDVMEAIEEVICFG